MSVLSLLRKRRTARARVAIGVSGNGVGLARVARGAGRSPVLEALDFREAQGLEAQQRAVLDLVRVHGVKDLPCSGLLEPGAYSLLLTEAPDVPDAELAEAVRWRVKDLVDFDVSNAVIDLFEVPGHKAATARPMIYVVVATDQGVRQRVDMLHAAGLDLDTIEVPELALRNLATLLPQDVAGTAMLWTDGEVGLINLTRQGVLYLARRFPLPLGNYAGLDPRPMLDSLVIEVQRSIDYYDSHFSLPPVSHLAVAPMALPGVADYLSSQLGLAATDVELGRLLDLGVEVAPALQICCSSLVGAALRGEVAA